MTKGHRVELQFDLGAFFEPYVRQWLITTDNRTSQWVEAVSFFYDRLSFAPPAYIDCHRLLQPTRY